MKIPTRRRTIYTSLRDNALATLLVVAYIGAATGFVNPTPCQTTNGRFWPGTLFASVLVDETVTEADRDGSRLPTTLSSSSSSSDDQGSDFDNCFPGRDENSKFDCHGSVAIWSNFQATRFSPFDENMRAISDIASRFSTMGINGGTYFAKHVARSAYFTVNALLGNAAFQLHERLVAGRGGGTGQSSGAAATASGGSPLLPLGMSGDIASRIVLEAMMSYEQDYEWIQRGVYREPWDMASGHRQSNPVNVLTQTGRLVRESIQTLSRRNRGTAQDKQVAFFGKDGSGNPPALYPEYYQNAFHYQTDGWMSSDSANVYETSTETLFLGRQDSMQRTSLPPIVALSDSVRSSGRTLRVLEVACGTGRFMTFVRDNLPLDAEYTAVDLSPFYLEKARDNDDYWRKTRAREEGRSSNSKGIAPAKLVQAQAEQLPFEDESFDVVVCVYLFHELPREVRARAAAEMARVVSPGGTVVLTDSIQRGDRPGLDASLVNFERFNEPYYRDYVADDLGLHFERQGLKPMTKITRSTTKSLSFGKPN